MKKYFFIIVVLIYSLTYSQGEANNWIFGYSAGINFSLGATNSISDPSINLRTEEGCSAFSDSAGNLLFYSDGKTVWNATNNVIQGGGDLLGNSSSTQSAMIIPKPNSATEYYIFTVGSTFNNGTPGFNYYTIDMAANNGLGSVTNGPINLSGSLDSQWTEKVAAVKGGDCDTYWVISYDGSNLKSYRVNATGVETTPVSTPAAAPSLDKRGYLKVSPDGKKLAIAHFLSYQDDPGGDSSVMLYDFDDITGQVTNGIRLFDDPNDNIHPYGLEFSRQSTKLYASTYNGFTNSLYQYDLNNTDIAASETLIQSQTGYRGALQIGPDGKIYATVPVSYFTGTQFLDVINNPEELGANCGYQIDAIDLGTGIATQGLPPFISSIFSPIEITGDDGSGNSVVLNGQLVNLCVGDDLTISPEPLTGIATYEWTFNGVFHSDTEDLVLPSITAAAIGDYNLEVTSIDICGRSSFRQGSFTIESVNEPPVANLITTQLVCDDNYNGTFAFDFNAMYDTTVLDGQDSAIFEVNYFDSQTDADDNTNPLPVPYDSPNITIFARIQNKNNTNCYDTTSFDITIYQSALPLDAASIEPLSYCDNVTVGSLTDGFIITDLTVYEALILNGQSASEFTLTYFSDVNYTAKIATPAAFQNAIAFGQLIYVRMNNNLEVNCFADTFFNLEIYAQPTANIPTRMFLCDDDNNGTMPFDLTSQDASINLEAGMSITYHNSQSDADLNLNPITSPFESGTTIIYARVENITNTTCYDTTSFDIEVYDSAFPLDSSSISDLSICDNISVGTDTDGIILFDVSLRGTEILNGQSPADFTLTYFTDAGYSLPINTPASFQNTIIGGQTIYVRMTNNSEILCYADTSFLIEVFELPIIQSTMLFKNCDEDGNPNGFTDFNLDEANDYITNGDTSLNVTYYTSFPDADAGSDMINPSPFNNATASTVYARVETADSCHRVSTIDLQVSTTSFPTDYIHELPPTCDDDDSIDGLHLFDLSLASADMIAQFPTGQNLSVHYYRDLTDAQLEQNEILPQTDYMSETEFSQTIYVRVESDDNGDCYGIGPHLTLTVYPRPEFEVEPIATVCLNLPPITLETFNPNGVYTYQWTDQNGMPISETSTVDVSTGGIYTVIASSGLNCESFAHTVTVIESDIATITQDDVTITDDSDNNTVTINNTNNNLGIGDYEFSLDNEFGFFQDESFFENVIPGIHTIYVRDKNSCGQVSLEISVIGFPKFFTPNNDGYNDNWQVLGVNKDFYPTSLIYIYDRFGKIMAKISPTSRGWNGYYNGVELPSDDYWFSVLLIDNNGVERTKKGHFSLIRR